MAEYEVETVSDRGNGKFEKLFVDPVSHRAVRRGVADACENVPRVALILESKVVLFREGGQIVPRLLIHCTLYQIYDHVLLFDLGANNQLHHNLVGRDVAE